MDRRAVVPAVLLSAVFGLFAGVVGMLMMAAYFPASLYVTTAESPVQRVQISASGQDRLPGEFEVRDLARPMALVYATASVTGATLASDAVGAGVALTSDGWVISHEEALEGLPAGTHNMSVVIDGNVLPVEESVTDPFSGTVFLLLKGAELPVASLGKSDGLRPGDNLFAFDPGFGLRIVDVISHSALPDGGQASALRSSERMQRMLRLSNVEGLLPGTPLFDSSGRAVAVYTGEGDLGHRAVPFDSFFDQIGSVLHQRSVDRPYLGVNFLDLSAHAGLSGEGERGALLRSGTSRPAVVRRSPAFESGLKEGDVILAVNGEAVSANKPLPELVAEYHAGDTIVMTVLRNGKERKFEVILERAISP